MESIAQFQDHYSLVFNHARKTLTQILIEGLIMVQPPEARPDKDDEAGSGLAQSLEFSNRSSIILRRSPVLSVFFEKGNGVWVRQFTANLLFIDQNERFSGRNKLPYFVNGFAQPPRIGRL